MTVTSPPESAVYTIGPRKPYTQVPRDALWSSPQVRGLSLPAKAIYLFLLTNPLIDAAGVIRSTPEAIAERLYTTSTDAVADALLEAERAGLVHRCGDEIFCTGWFEISSALDGENTFKAFVTAEQKISHDETRRCVHAWLKHGVRCRSELSGGVSARLATELRTWGDKHNVDFGQIKKLKTKKGD